MVYACYSCPDPMLLQFLKKNLSPSFDKRPKGVKPSIVLLHYTGMETAQAAFDRLCDPASKVSAHYFIDEDGKTTQLVKDDLRAWHAGVSFWQGITDINAHSIGIEIVNPGHDHGYRSFPPLQMMAVAKLCNTLIKKYDIRADRILAHSDVAPERKQDPGELFDWHFLYGEGIGLIPQPTQADFDEAAKRARSDFSLHTMLEDYGYSALAAYEDLVVAFHRHFAPEKFQPGQNPAKPDEATIARLLSLIRQQKALKA